jgi:exonuclease SbcC
MSIVKLKSISLKNFKGIKEFAINDIAGNVTISGDNGTGKSTIMDGFLWCLFGKDSHDRKDFEVKTLNPDGSPIHYLEHEVSVCLLIDGQEKYLKRTLKEKWVKKRGEEVSEMQGNETLFEINSVPYQANEYKSQIDQIVPESVFKLVSSPTYFNSLPWKERRNILTSICGVIPEPEGYDFIKQKKAEIGLDKYKSEIAAKKKLLKEELLLVPARIDEAFKSTPEKVNEAEINKKISINDKSISEIDIQLTSAAERFDKINQTNLDKKKKASEISGKMQDIKNRIEQENRFASQSATIHIQKAKDVLPSIQANINVVNDNIKKAEEKVANLQIGIENLRKIWADENAKELVINGNDLNCPTCKRPLDNIESMKDELTTSFNAKKAQNLIVIREEGIEKAKQQKVYIGFIEDYKKELESHTLALTAATKELESGIFPVETSVKSEVNDPEYLKLQKELEAITYDTVVPENTDTLKTERQTLQTKNDELRKQLTINEMATKGQARITELQARERELAQLIADLERIEFQIEGYTRSFVTEVETKVNSMFSIAKFQLFSTLINGGIEECCETVVNGIPYSSNLNTSMKTLVGLDIISVLGKFYKVSAPVFIDNSEQIVTIPEMEFQIIKLVVDGRHKVLTVSNQ